jgi:hypothetical protein
VGLSANAAGVIVGKHTASYQGTLPIGGGGASGGAGASGSSGGGGSSSGGSGGGR